VTDPCSPYTQEFDPPLASGGDGPLSGLVAAVKDNFDIAGHVTGNGNPEWAATHAPATETGTLVSRLLAAGVAIAGKSQMDELAYSLIGKNARYGTPVNPAAPDRVPGGSSSGSAVLVASGAVDFAVGSDTGGSVRMPAAFNGTFGLRPTHGSLPDDGLVPLAPSYDAPGFFTRDLGLMAQVLAIAADREAAAAPLGDLRAPGDLWAMADADTAASLKAALPDVEIDQAPLLEDGDYASWFECFRVHQAYEVWQALGAWVSATNPAFGPGVAERFDAASRITDDQFAWATSMRAEIRARLDAVIGPDTCLIVPTTPAIAPLLTASEAELDAYRKTALSLLCVAGHGGLPQLTMPVAGPGGVPVGLSLIGSRGRDADLIKTAQVVWGR
jgi:amidase